MAELLRTLREGTLYCELVRLASPSHYHRMRRLREPAAIFVAMQHFLITSPALAGVRAHRKTIDVSALEVGKAFEHRALLSIMKAVLDQANYEVRVASVLSR